MGEKVQKTDDAWRLQLAPEQYEITRERGTEPAFSGIYWDHKAEGVYRCVCCGAALFSSEAKFDSGCGWPSFHSSAGDNAVETTVDTRHGRQREEILCSRCDAHLGHVFPDGPQPTGLRYCVNSAALDFDENKKGAGQEGGC